MANHKAGGGKLDIPDYETNLITVGAGVGAGAGALGARSNALSVGKKLC